MLSVSIFGSTGSIGQNTVSLLEEGTHVRAITCASNVELLAEQAKSLNAEIAVVADAAKYQDLKDALTGTNVKTAAGAEAIRDAACLEVDWAMSAIVGSAGLSPTLEMAKHAKVLALANKESMVCAGELVNAACATSGCQLIPVDSEHSAVFQALHAGQKSEISRIILTSSGGPFRDWPREQMRGATLAQALNHPNFDMGQRISIDSATMFNKALELIEAQHLFDVAPDQIEAVIHPQQYVHSMVEFRDNSIIAQIAAPDMRGAIGYALHYPERLPLPVAKLDFASAGRWDFQPPDETRFPALKLAREVMQAGGLSGTVFNAAKEAALDHFIAGKIGFLDMADLIAYVLDQLGPESAQRYSTEGLEVVMDMDNKARTIGHNWRPS